jgi:hypothetical protein
MAVPATVAAATAPSTAIAVRRFISFIDVSDRVVPGPLGRGCSLARACDGN